MRINRSLAVILATGMLLLPLAAACSSTAAPEESASPTAAARELAASWPAVVPGPAEAVLLSSAEDAAAQAASAVWVSELEPAAAFEAYAATLTAAGLAQTALTPTEDALGGTHVGAGYTVEISAYASGSSTLITAVVRPE